MSRMAKETKGSSSSTFSMGLIAIGCLFTLIGYIFKIFCNPLECSLSSNFFHCSPGQLFLLIAMITFLSSGALMVIGGSIMFCCTFKKTKTGSKAPPSTKDLRAVKQCKIKPISTIHVITEEKVIVVKEKGPQIAHYNPPLHYKDQNLVLDSEILSNGNVKHTE